MTLHADALATLRDWEPPSDEQQRLRRRYVEHLEQCPDGLSRDCVPDHITASTLVVSDDLTSVLLTLHAKAGAWFQLGGHCEPDDETLADAALREATEESGVDDLDLDPVPVQLSEHTVPFCGPGGNTHHLDVRFLAVAPSAAEPRGAGGERSDRRLSVSDESLEVRWWPVAGLPSQDADVVELVRLALERAQSAGLA